MTWDCIVVGGGCAGLAAATKLAAEKKAVLLIEKSSFLGGRASSFEEEGEVIDNGQHLMLGCYEHTQAYLRRIGNLDQLKFFDTFETVMRGYDGKAVLKTFNLPAPLHLVWGLIKYSPLSFGEKLNTLRVSLKFFGNLKNKSVKNLLEEAGQSANSQKKFWDPLILATLNAQAEEVPARWLKVVMQKGFMHSRKASRMGLSLTGLSTLFGGGVQGYLEKNGGKILLRTSFAKLMVEGEKIMGVEDDKGEKYFSQRVVLALPPNQLLKVSQNFPEKLKMHVKQAEDLIPSAIVSVYVWLKSTVNFERVTGFWDSSFHWLFNREKIISGSKHITLVTSRATVFEKKPAQEIMDEAKETLKKMYPNEKIEIEKMLIKKEPYATWLPKFLDERGRLGRTTPLKNLFVCGDWTNTGLPPTIEGAVQSGHEAATEVMKG